MEKSSPKHTHVEADVKNLSHPIARSNAQVPGRHTDKIGDILVCHVDAFGLASCPYLEVSDFSCVLEGRVHEAIAVGETSQ